MRKIINDIKPPLASAAPHFSPRATARLRRVPTRPARARDLDAPARARARAAMTKRRTALVVLGDFGRSPRMQYHALSLARDADRAVDVVCYSGTPPIDALSREDGGPRVSGGAGRGRGCPRGPRGRPRGARAAAQCAHLFWILMTMQRCEEMLIQNPPCVPTFLVCGIVCRARRTRLVVDWHNFAYTLFGMKRGDASATTRMLKWYERTQGKMWGDAHVCVTKAMGNFLEKEWKIEGARVVEDRAAERFREAAREATTPLEFWRSEPARSALEASPVARSEDALDRFLRGTHENMTKNKPRFIVSSTSWTPDEDFGVLLDAAVAYDARKRAKGDHASKSYPDIVIIITGQGPQKTMYEKKINELALEHVAFRTVWLDAADYPRALANAHLGVSLHTSSSGLDLPMKIVDMFGASLPVAAMRYAVIGELVQEGVNGVLFADATELAAMFAKLLRGDERLTLRALKHGAAKWGEQTWDDHWKRCALPVFADAA